MSRNVTLPTGIVVPKRGVWLHESCPRADEHDPVPADFNENTGLSKTHRQVLHTVCGLYSKWAPR